MATRTKNENAYSALTFFLRLDENEQILPVYDVPDHRECPIHSYTQQVCMSLMDQ